MIYKIVTEFNILIDIVEKIQKKYNVLIKSGQLFICNKEYKNIPLNKIKKEIGIDNVFILQINENNLQYESPEVISWCKDYFVDRDVKKYEQERQEDLKNYMKILDNFEQELENMIKEGGVADVRNKTKR